MFGISIAWVLVAILGGIVAGRLVKRVDDKIEERRAHALEVSRVLAKQGLTVLPPVLEAYATGNYSEVLKALRKARITLDNPAAAAAEFEGIFNKMLETKLANGDVRAALLQRIQGDAKVTAAAKPVATSA